MLKKIIKFVGKTILVVVAIWCCLFALVLVVGLFASVDSGIDSAVETITGVELTEGGHAKPKTESNSDDVKSNVSSDNIKVSSNDIDTPIKLDNTKSSTDVEKRPTPVVEEVRPEPVVPNEVLNGDVYVTQQLNSGYYVITQVEYTPIGYDVITSAKGAPFGVIIADGSIKESGCYEVIIEVTGHTRTLQDGSGFTYEVPIFKFSTEENYNAYKNYINGGSSSNTTQSVEVEEPSYMDAEYPDTNISYTYRIGDRTEVDRKQFHIISNEQFDGYSEIVFGIGDTGPYSSMVWEDDYLPDFNNTETFKLMVVSTDGEAFYEGSYIPTIEFDFIQ